MVSQVGTEAPADGIRSTPATTPRDGGTPLPRPREQVITPPTDWDKRGVRALLAIMREDRRANLGDRPTTAGDWLVPAVQALSVYRFGQWIDAATFPRWVRPVAEAAYSLMFIRVRNRLGIELPKTVRLGRRVTFVHQHGVAIHPYATIGDGCALRHCVTLGTRSAVLNDGPVVGSDVTFGVGCAVIGPVRIGDGAIIGPNAVVTTDLPAGASVVAPPSRVLRLDRAQD